MKHIMTMLMIFAIANCKPKKSPEERMTELLPKVIEVTCSKMIDCGKEELAKIPENMRNMIPDMMQSKDKCIAFMKEQEKKSKEMSPNAQKEKITNEEITAAESCIKGMEAAKCEDLKNQKGPGSIPGCDSLQKIMK